MKPIRYISTRGEQTPLTFKDAVMTGLARDGGLLIPDRIPNVTDKLEDWKDLDYPDLAFEIIRLFTDDIPEARLRELIASAYSSFTHPEVAPLRRIGTTWILELFHGPTLAFKDIALQFLGRLFEEILEERNGQLNILAATSGDTGSAAICGVRGQNRIQIFVMHPKGRVSPLQERQMTSVLDANVFNLAVEGSFDDCQLIMKTLFSDLPFKDAHALGTVNSVNWARVLAQTVYYFYSFFRVQERTGAKEVQFSVPTGNFGDIMAGYLATQMGLPVKKLILATNENNILSRFFNSGEYSMGSVVPTLSPSMDIQVASNFERYLYYRTGKDSAKLSELMDGFAESGALTVEGSDDLFAAGEAGTEETLATIRKYSKECRASVPLASNERDARSTLNSGYMLDPHTAVGVAVAERFADASAPTICLATAHPAKFTEAIEQATGETAHHPVLDKLANAETRCDSIANDEAAIRDYLVEKTRS